MSRTISIHQPQYLPWLPYLDKADRCDVFVYLDTVQYQKGGVQNRNQIKTPAGPAWLTVPVQASIEDKINEVAIAAQQPWARKHLSTIQGNYARSPFLATYLPELKAILEAPARTLGELNIAVCEWLFGHFGITSRRVKASDLAVEGRSTELILNICRSLNATRYLSGHGAKAYQNEEEFKAAGITLEYQEYSSPEYRQLHSQPGFTPHLSALDLLLNLGPEAGEVMRKGQTAASSERKSS